MWPHLFPLRLIIPKLTGKFRIIWTFLSSWPFGHQQLHDTIGKPAYKHYLAKTCSLHAFLCFAILLLVRYYCLGIQSRNVLYYYTSRWRQKSLQGNVRSDIENDFLNIQTGKTRHDGHESERPTWMGCLEQAAGHLESSSTPVQRINVQPWQPKVCRFVSIWWTHSRGNLFRYFVTMHGYFTWLGGRQSASLLKATYLRGWSTTFKIKFHYEIH